MTTARRGRLIAVEGIDGCGKSTQAGILAGELGAVLTHEPGATPLGMSIRLLSLDPARPAPLPRAEALLMAADRAQHVDEVLRPALVAGRWVVTDRYSGSTLAYQGWGRGLPPDGLRRVVEWAADGVEPDVSVLVDVEPDMAAGRLRAAAPDRLEQLDAEFFGRVREGFLAQASAGGARWVVVDGSGEVDVVAEAISRAVAERLGPAPASGAPPRGSSGGLPG